METCGLPSFRGKATKLIMLHTLHRLKNDTLRAIELSIYRPSLLLSLTPKSDEIAIRRIRSSDNLVDLFIKALSTVILKKFLGIHRLKDLYAALLEKI